MKILLGLFLLAFGCAICLFGNPLMLIWGVPPICTGLAIFLNEVLHPAPKTTKSTAKPAVPSIIDGRHSLVGLNHTVLRRMK